MLCLESCPFKSAQNRWKSSPFCPGSYFASALPGDRLTRNSGRGRMRPALSSCSANKTEQPVWNHCLLPLQTPRIPGTHHLPLLKARQITETRLLLAVWLGTYSLQSFVRRNVPAFLDTNLPSFPTHLVLSHFYYCKILSWKVLSQVPEVREGGFCWSNESYCLSGLVFFLTFSLFLCLSGKCLIFFFFFSHFPPLPASVPISLSLSILDLGRLRATIRATVCGAGHMARNAK